MAGERSVLQVQVSAKVCRRVASTALRLAVERAPKKTGKGAAGLFPIAKDGVIGIGVRSWVYYMKFQELGIRPFTMWALQGKTIPMNINGQLVFRVASNVGKPGRINKRDPETGRILSSNVGVKWRHPGLEPKNFIHDSIADAIRIHKQEIILDIKRGVVKQAKAVMKEKSAA